MLLKDIVYAVLKCILPLWFGRKHG